MSACNVSISDLVAMCVMSPFVRATRSSVVIVAPSLTIFGKL